MSAGYVVVRKEVQARRVALETAQASEERFRVLVDGVRDYGIYLLDPNGIVTSWNAGAERLKGYSAAEIVGKSFSVFYPPEDIAVGRPARELAFAAEHERYEETALRVRKDGCTFWANIVLTALRRDDGTLRGFAKITRDVSERKRAETALFAANAALHMPKKNGIEALREIKADPGLRGIPVIVLTTSGQDVDILQSYDLGASSYITKPVTFDGLLKVIGTLGQYWFQLVQLRS